MPVEEKEGNVSARFVGRTAIVTGAWATSTGRRQGRPRAGYEAPAGSQERSAST